MNQKILLFAILLTLVGGAFAAVLIVTVKSPKHTQNQNDESITVLEDNSINETKVASNNRDNHRLRMLREELANRRNARNAFVKKRNNLRSEKINEDTAESLEEPSNKGQQDSWKREDPIGYLNSQMRKEGQDPEWSSYAEQSIAEKVANAELPNLVNKKVTCSANICQVSLDFGGAEALSRIINDDFQKILALSTWDADGYFTSDDNDNLHLFFPREGHQLPSSSQKN